MLDVVVLEERLSRGWFVELEDRGKADDIDDADDAIATDDAFVIDEN